MSSLPSLVSQLANAQAISLTPVQAAAVVTYCRKETKRKQDRITRAVSAGKAGEARGLAGRLQGSFDSRLVAAYEARLRTVGAEVALASFDACVAHARTLGRDARLNGRVFPVRKPDGSSRFVCDFDLDSRARQTLAKLALEPLVPSHPSQYTRRGHLALREAVQHAATVAMAEAVFVRLDVQAFYPSINARWLAENLPLREARTRSVVLAEDAFLRGHYAKAGKGRLGLPQGAVCSPIVGDFVMKAALSDLARWIGEERVFIYADDIGLLVEPHEVDQAVDAIRTAMLRFQGGPFRISTAGPWPARRGFWFLGNWYLLRQGRMLQFMPAAYWATWAAYLRDELETALIGYADPEVSRNLAREACLRAIGRFAHHLPCPRAKAEHAWWVAIFRTLEGQGREAAYAMVYDRPPGAFLKPWAYDLSPVTPRTEWIATVSNRERGRPSMPTASASS